MLRRQGILWERMLPEEKEEAGRRENRKERRRAGTSLSRGDDEGKSRKRRTRKERNCFK